VISSCACLRSFSDSVDTAIIACKDMFYNGLTIELTQHVPRCLAQEVDNTTAVASS
jgi:hypothetical protein